MNKTLLIGILLIFQISIKAQKFIDGPANLRNNPKGELILSIDNNVNIVVWENTEDWYKIVLSGYIKESSLKNEMLIKDSEIYDNTLKKIGKSLTDLDISENFEKSEIEGYLYVSIVGFTFKTNIKELSIEEIRQSKQAVFSDSSNTQLLIYNDNGTTYYHSIETNYLLTYKWLNGGFDDLLVKIIKTKKYARGSEGSDTKIDLIFYPKLSKIDTICYSKNTDRFELLNNYLISEKYGCCGAENVYELSTFPGNVTFLEYTTNFYHIVIPNTKNELFFGVNIEPRFQDKTGKIVCELNYSYNFHKSGKIIFKTKTESQRENIPPFTPEIELISRSKQDIINKHLDYSEMTAWSMNNCEDFSKINNIGIRVTFTNDTNGSSKEFEIFVENGKISQNEIIIDL